MTEVEKLINEVLESASRWEARPSNYLEAYPEVKSLALAAPKLARALREAVGRIDDLGTHGPRQKAVADLAVARIEQIVKGAE